MTQTTQHTITEPVLWAADPDQARRSRIAEFTSWVRERRGVTLPQTDGVPDYRALHDWSVRDLEGFWSSVAEHFGVLFHDQPTQAVRLRGMPATAWFPGATLNYAEHALTPGPGREDADTAIIAVRENGSERTVSHAELREMVARARAGLIAAGVTKGDRVVALMPNSTETLVAFLATASIGAVWSSCSPDFGPRAVLDRFAQLEPSVLIAVDGYEYNGRQFDVRETVAMLQASLPTLTATVLIPYLDTEASLDGTTSWDALIAHDAPLTFAPVPFDHFLWVLYSSGTTGLPKGIVHSHGGILVEHLKALALQHDLGPGNRFMWFTTTGWMMWNYLISGLLVGATLVLYDGSPGHPDLDALWALAERHRVNLFGTSAPFLKSCQGAGVIPAASQDLSAMKALGSTGSPLSADQFDWIASAVGDTVQICSVSGGTDMCTAFLTSAPTVPVWRGELSCAALGASIHAVAGDGTRLIDEVGEMVIDRPMPSMPVTLWGDANGARMHDTYFAEFPGLWRHGDWVRETPHGSFVITGRSDATLNRGGIRMGTGDLYAVIEGFAEVEDSLVIDTTALGSDEDGALLCFVVLAGDAQLDSLEPQLRSALRKQLSPRHVPDRFVVVAEVPRTLTGKKCEVPVKRILAGVAADQAVSRESLRNPDSLIPFLAMARRPG